LKHLEGAFALAFLFDGEEDLIVAARKGSPLAIGHGDGRCSWAPTPSRSAR
jgi:glucosamine--fructose-6-phosphate aminotransferase (isomerizing)